MVLKKGLLFDRRYMLICNLGRGASAQVWLAQDTMVNNLLVAIKVLSSYQGIDTLGIQNFQKEFSYVYNIQHQNLLTPTNYAICDKTPYLVLPYCENGSATSMLGRSDENDVIKFLHDVSAALECLHSHNIVHQDIKPDNVLLDDDCNFLVTDFGISTQSVGTVTSESCGSKGTKAYMGPERFDKNAVPINMNDIWALGATAYEMIMGNPPYGDNGGMVQAIGESIPDLPETIQPEVRQIIISCLDAEPWNRPSAESIRKKTQLYLETGSWKEKDGRKYMYYSISAAVILLLGVVLGVWDYNRTKIVYYKDYVEYWGIPEGIGRLSGSEMHHRQQSYRMEFSQRKLRRLSLVNPEENLIGHNDTENMISRYVDVRYYYTDNGRIDYKAVYDQAGKLLFKMDYDEALKTVTFRQNDEYGTEMNLRANTTELQNQGRQLFESKSKISRYLLTYDEKGLLTKLLYVGLQNVPAGDAENVYGIQYKYDDKGHKIEEQFLGADGTPTCNGIGLSIKQFEYDEENNWSAVRYLNIDREASHDGNNCPLVRIKSDEWGNRIEETYHTIDGELSVRTDMGVSGFKYEYDDNGHCISHICIGIDGNNMPCRYGYVKHNFGYDENGYINIESFFDGDGNPASMLDDGNSVSSYRIENNKCGFPVTRSMFDEDGNPFECTYGFSKLIMNYDSLGNMLSIEYRNKSGEPVEYNGLYSKISLNYDEFYHVVSMRYYDTKNNLTINEDGISGILTEYNRQGAVTSIKFVDDKGKLTIGSGFYAQKKIDYDELGNEKTWQFFDAEGHLANNDNGVAREEFVYDSKTNFLIETRQYDYRGILVSARHMSHDKRGNTIKEYTVGSSGQLKNGTAVSNSEYNSDNQVVKNWWTNLKGQLVNCPGTKYAKSESKYDKRGNKIEQTFWDISGKPSVDGQGAFKREQRFNDLGLVIYERNLDATGKPLTGSKLNPEGRCEYDKQGNLIKLECYDGYGKPRLSSDGFFRMISKYNKQNKIVETSYFGVDGQLVMSHSNDYAKKTWEYNKKGLETLSTCYDVKGMSFRYDAYKYNEKNRLTEQLIQNEKRQQDDKFWGFSKMIISYNSNGLIPIQRTFYSKAGAKLGYQPYNSTTKQWGQVVVLNNQHHFNVVGGQWRQTIMEMAAQCPMDAGNGVQIRSLTLDGEIVTCIVRLINVNKEEISDEKIEELRGLLQFIKGQLRKALGLPSSVILEIEIQDKKGNRI